MKSYEELDVVERLEVLVNTVGDLRNGFAPSVNPARWVADYQAHLRQIIEEIRLKNKA